MSTKAEKRAAAAKVLREAGAEDGLPPEGLAVISLFTDMLESLDRIAAALEGRATIAPMGAGAVMGELAKFEPAIDPKMVRDGVIAMGRIATALEYRRDQGGHIQDSAPPPPPYPPQPD